MLQTMPVKTALLSRVGHRLGHQKCGGNGAASGEPGVPNF